VQSPCGYGRAQQPCRTAQELGPWCAAATLRSLLRQPSATGRNHRGSNPVAALTDDWLDLAPAPAMGLADSWCGIVSFVDGKSSFSSLSLKASRRAATHGQPSVQSAPSLCPASLLRALAWGRPSGEASPAMVLDRMKAGGEAEEAQTQAQVAGETHSKRRHEKRLAVSFEEAKAIEVLLGNCSV